MRRQIITLGLGPLPGLGTQYNCNMYMMQADKQSWAA